MTIATTSLKLTKRLKSRLERLHQAFVYEGMRADEAMQRSGRGYESQSVHAYLAAKARRGKPRRPKAVRWRG